MQPKNSLLIFVLLLLFTNTLQAQNNNRERFVHTALKVNENITVDGVLNETPWKDAQPTSPFINKWPIDSGYAEAQTEVKMLFDNNFVYVSAVIFQKKDDLVIQSIKRDQLDAHWLSENFAFVVDPLNQKNTGFIFAVNAGGAQLDGMLTLQGSWTITNENWDNKWFSAVQVLEDRWIVEMAMPFSALRFKKDIATWSVNFIRTDKKRNLFSTWAQIPLQFNGVDLGHFGTLQFDGEFAPKQSKVTLVPYASASSLKNFEEQTATKTSTDIGLDAKIALTSSMNLDITYRPDFSNVDVDRQVTNLTRFSILFPERRNFFLENADLFSNFGSWQVKPFFSRKIGIQEGEAIPIRVGARITGNINRSLRMGVMNIQTDATENFSGNNYTIGSLQQNVLKRSNIKLFMANRQKNHEVEGDGTDSFNRTFGGEFQYISANGKLMTTARLHSAKTPEKPTENEYVSFQTSYNTTRFYAGLMGEKVGVNYLNDFSFVPRLYNYDAQNDTTVRIGHYTLNPWFGLLIRPGKYGINVIDVNTWSLNNYHTNGNFLERMTSINVSVLFKNTSRLFVETLNTEVNLPVAAGIISNDTPLPADHYMFTNYTVRYASDRRKLLTADINVTQGSFYNGTRTEWGATLNARLQPWGNFGISYLQNEVILPVEFGRASFQLIGPRTEISFRNNIWWTTFLQYNTQADNFNINSRLQWRFKPMSDLFIVYTDNYTADNFIKKNRGLVVKLTYWLNL